MTTTIIIIQFLIILYLNGVRIINNLQLHALHDLNQIILLTKSDELEEVLESIVNQIKETEDDK